MTIIAYANGEMAADSCSFSGGIRYASCHQKIVKGPFGLVGVAGRASDCELAREWFVAGMPDEKPDFSQDKDDPMLILWAKPDGTAYHADNRLKFVQIDTPATAGERDASTFCEGAMAAGLGAAAAVRLTVSRCIYTGGEVQVERLHSSAGDIIEVRHGETFDQALKRARG